MSEEGAQMTRRRRASPAAPAYLPDDDDLLREILLRLPPQPSSLPRASFVCKRWRRLATDPQFLRRFCARHRKPPLLGVFECRDKLVFSSILDPPDRIPPERFSLPCNGGFYLPCNGGFSLPCNGGFSLPGTDDLLGCRHGRVLAIDRTRHEVIVCDPITGEHRRVAIPPEFNKFFVNGTVLCAAGDQGHVHGACHSSPFKVVLVSICRGGNSPIACVYSSETGIWGNLITTAVPCQLYDSGLPGTLVGNALYWTLSPMDRGMLEFDLDSQSLAVIKGPPYNHTPDGRGLSRRYSLQIIQAGDGGVGLAVLSYPSFQMWQRKVDCHNVATWVLQKTVKLNNILRLGPEIVGGMKGSETILGYAEDADVIFVWVDSSVFMVQLESMQSRRLYESNYINNYHPFTSFYTAGTAIADGYDGAEMLYDT